MQTVNPATDGVSNDPEENTPERWFSTSVENGKHVFSQPTDNKPIMQSDTVVHLEDTR